MIIYENAAENPIQEITRTDIVVVDGIMAVLLAISPRGVPCSRQTIRLRTCTYTI